MLDNVTKLLWGVVVSVAYYAGIVFVLGKCSFVKDVTFRDAIIVGAVITAVLADVFIRVRFVNSSEKKDGD